MVRVAVIGFVMGEVTTSLVIVTGLDTALEAGDADKVVDSSAPAPAGLLGGCRGGKRCDSGQKDGKKEKLENMRHSVGVLTLWQLCYN